MKKIDSFIEQTISNLSIPGLFPSENYFLGWDFTHFALSICNAYRSLAGYSRFKEMK